MIRFKNVCKKYGEKTILDDLNFEIEEGKFVVLIGPSGCGKTTTLRSINRLIEPNSGHIFINDKDVSAVNPVKLRRTIGYVIQQIGLFPNMTVEENIAVVLKLLKYPKSKIHSIVCELLDMVNMPYSENAKKYPSELSGGQQQRIGVLRALAASPPIVLMDEPFGALDPLTRDSLQDEIKKIQKKLHKTIVFVTHDMGEALRLADTIIFMNHGKILQMASPEEMLSKPADPMIREFLGKHVSADNSSTDLLAADFMRTKVLKVTKDKHTLECIDLMVRNNVNSLVVINDDDTYAGTVFIENIKTRGKAGKEIGELVSNDAGVVNINDNAKDAFDMLLTTAANYVVVLNENRTVAGLITKTSMAKAMGEALWGEIDS